VTPTGLHPVKKSPNFESDSQRILANAAVSTASKPKGWPNALTHFLLSLAKAKGARVVAVILSGMDGDGSAALAAIKSEGGMTFAQLHAAYDSTPVSAEETGHVDFILSSADITKALLGIAKNDSSQLE